MINWVSLFFSVYGFGFLVLNIEFCIYLVSIVIKLDNFGDFIFIFSTVFKVDKSICFYDILF